MNHYFNPARIMSDSEMLEKGSYIVEVTANNGERKPHKVDDFLSGLRLAGKAMNPYVHMIIIKKEIEGKKYTQGLQRWNRERETGGNTWEEGEVEELITLGQIREIQFIKMLPDGSISSDEPPKSYKKVKHHWWFLLDHIDRYADYIKNYEGDGDWANELTLNQLRLAANIVEALGSICDYQEENKQSTKFPFMKAGKRSKVALSDIQEYINNNITASNPEFAAKIAKLSDAVSSTFNVADDHALMAIHKFSIVWQLISTQWQDLTYF